FKSYQTMSNNPSTTPLKRLASLDFMRGVIMVLLMLESTELYMRLNRVTPENTVGSSIIGQFFHNPWEGLHFWDIIQPAFMFMAGIAMVYSAKKQRELGVLPTGKISEVTSTGFCLGNQTIITYSSTGCRLPYTPSQDFS
ncbi:MAG: hypothetical protein Q4G08_11245, partial [Capnocytophaga sp.]|nr:hypothetical protein [Capnocytophaga sp.]